MLLLLYIRVIEIYKRFYNFLVKSVNIIFSALFEQHLWGNPPDKRSANSNITKTIKELIKRTKKEETKKNDIDKIKNQSPVQFTIWFRVGFVWHPKERHKVIYKYNKYLERQV